MSINQDQTIIRDKEWLLRFLTDKSYRRSRHVFALTAYLLLILVGKDWRQFHGLYDHLDWILTYVVLMALFYLNLRILVPRYFYNAQTTVYLVYLTLTIASACLVLFLFHRLIFDHHRILTDSKAIFDLGDVLAGIFYLTPFYLFATAIKLFQRWVNDTQRINEMENKALQSELIALRNQIQPHFLFNMLNSIQVVNNRNPKLASHIIYKLSDFLRYQLYESNHHEVYLSSEIQFISDFLELEKVRRDQFEYNVEVEQGSLGDMKIPPHFLLTLVENATKHSLDPMSPSDVSLRITRTTDRIYICCENSVPEIKVVDKPGGLGLENMKRRLELLYGDTFTLESNSFKNRYTVELKIPT